MTKEGEPRPKNPRALNPKAQELNDKVLGWLREHRSAWETLDLEHSNIDNWRALVARMRADGVYSTRICLGDMVTNVKRVLKACGGNP